MSGDIDKGDRWTVLEDLCFEKYEFVHDLGRVTASVKVILIHEL